MEGPIYIKSDQFARGVVAVYNKLIAKNEQIMSRQLLRSGTSVGANVSEASSAESLKDFISKNSIALKEAKEAIYWLKLLKNSNIIDYNFDDIISLNDEIIRILSKIIITSKTRLNSKHLKL